MRQIVKIIKLVAVLSIFFASVRPARAQEEFSESIESDTVVQPAPEEAQESVESVVETVTETIEEVSTEIESTHEEVNQVVESEQDIEVTDETIDPVLKVSKVIDDNTLYIEGVANPGVLVQILKQDQVVGSDYATSNGGFEVELKESIQAGTNLVIESVEDGGTIATLNETVRETGIHLSHPLYETSEDVVGITSPEQRVEVLDNQNSVIASGISDVNGQFTVSLSEQAEIGSQVSIRVYDRDRIARVEVLNVELDPSIVIDKPDIPSEINTSSLKNESEDDLFIHLDHEVYEDTTELVGKTVPGALVSLIDAEGNAIDTVTSDETGVFRMVLDEGFGVGETIQIQVRLGLKSSSMKIEIKQQLETVEPMMMNLSSMQTFSASISQNGFISVEPVYDTSENININININRTNKSFTEILRDWLLSPFITTKYQVYLEENGKSQPIANKPINLLDDEFIREINENKSKYNLDGLQAGDQFKIIVTLEKRNFLGTIYEEKQLDELTVVVQGNQFGFSSNPPTNITFESTQITSEPNKVIPRVGNIPISFSIIDTRKNGQWNLTVSSTPLKHKESGHLLENVLYFKDGMNGQEQPIDKGVLVDTKNPDDSAHEKSKNWGQGEGIILKMNPIQAMPGEYTSTITWTLTDGPL